MGDSLQKVENYIIKIIGNEWNHIKISPTFEYLLENFQATRSNHDACSILPELIWMEWIYLLKKKAVGLQLWQD